MKFIKPMAILLLATAPSMAHATVYDLSYLTADGHALAARLTGTLQPDNNTVIVTSVADFARLDGTPGDALPFVDSASDVYSGATGVLPTLSLDGTHSDFVACETVVCNQGFVFVTANWIGLTFFNSSSDFGALFDVFDRTRYSLAVPEPANWALMVVGMGAVGFAMRRRAMVAVSFA